MSRNDLASSDPRDAPAPDLFVAESRELLRDMETALLTLVQYPQDAEAINAVFRAMHTIKGTSGAFGFGVIVEFTHVLEGVMVQVRSGKLGVNEDLLALLLDCGDHLSSLIDCLEHQDRMARLEAAGPRGAAFLARVERLLADSAAASLELAANPAWHVSARFGSEVLRDGMDPLSFIRYLSTLGEVSVSALFESMPEGAAMDPQACYAGVEIQFTGTVERQALEDAFEWVRDNSVIRILPPHAPLSDYARLIQEAAEGTGFLGQLLVESGALTVEELQRICDLHEGIVVPKPAQAAELAVPAAPQVRRSPDRVFDTRSVRVGAAKLDDLIELLGELVIASAGVTLGARRAGDMELLEAAATMNRLVEAVRDNTLTLRMVPIGETFNRFHRVVHDLGRELGKDVELVINGADTELDKSMVEKLSDPLVHLVRNALDHGIEAPENRLKAGKPARARLLLNAYHETGTVVIEVVDDGAGLDREKILARALEKGLVTPGQALSEHEVFQLVMEPGFSTAAKPTSVSGRGIGMDVVRRNVETLRGSVTIHSVARQGTTMALRVPLTLAIIDGFMVAVGRATYVIPLETVVECMQLTQDGAATEPEMGYVNLRGKVLPLLRLRDVFDTVGEPAKRENVVVVNYGGQQAGLVVDGLLGEFQTVIKPLGKLFERLAGISGSTILGSGEVALILDVPALVQRTLQPIAGRERLDPQGRSTCSTI